MRKLRVSSRINRWAYLFILPTVLILLIFRFIPMAAAGFLSLTNYDLFTKPKVIGIRNFIDLLQDASFLQAVRVSFTYVIGSVIPVWILSLFLALMTVKLRRGGGTFRTLIFIPVVLAPVVVAVLWRFLYFEYGLVNEILRFFGVSPIPWLTHPTAAILALIHIGIWRASPYFMVIFTAGLQAIPEEFYEAGRIDGTNAISEFFYITLPILKPIFLLVIVISVITALKVFEIPQLMTDGGPAGATEVIPLHIYKTGFVYFKMGRAAAMSILLFLIMMVFSWIQVKLFSENR